MYGLAKNSDLDFLVSRADQERKRRLSRFICDASTIRRMLSLSLASTEDRQECLSYLSKNDQDVMFVAVVDQGNVRRVEPLAIQFGPGNPSRNVLGIFYFDFVNGRVIPEKN